jgi:hypothetical protein
LEERYRSVVTRFRGASWEAANPASLLPIPASTCGGFTRYLIRDGLAAHASSAQCTAHGIGGERDVLAGRHARRAAGFLPHFLHLAPRRRSRGVSCHAHAYAPAAGKKVLWEVDLDIKPELKAVDQRIARHLQSFGFAVTTVGHDEPATAAAGYDLVVVSSSVSAQNVEGRFKNIRLPALTWESFILYHTRTVGKIKEVDYTAERREELRYLWIANAPRPIAAGVPNGLVEVYRKPLPNHQTNWDSPLPGANVIGHLPGEPAKSDLFCYEKGSMMDADFVAPARRVMLFLHTDTFDEFTDDGRRIFDAAILLGARQSHRLNRKAPHECIARHPDHHRRCRPCRCD